MLIYSLKEHESVSGVVESLKIVTEERSMRIAEFAFARVSTRLFHINYILNITFIRKNLNF